MQPLRALVLASAFAAALGATAGVGTRAGAFLVRGGHRVGGVAADVPTTPPEIYLANHLKDKFELDREGNLQAQSGLNIPWNYDEVKPRNARDDCKGGAP